MSPDTEYTPPPAREPTPAQRAMARAVRAAMARFYADPANAERFEEWRRRRGRAPRDGKEAIA